MNDLLLWTANLGYNEVLCKNLRYPDCFLAVQIAKPSLTMCRGRKLLVWSCLVVSHDGPKCSVREIQKYPKSRKGWNLWKPKNVQHKGRCSSSLQATTARAGSPRGLAKAQSTPVAFTQAAFDGPEANGLDHCSSGQSHTGVFLSILKKKGFTTQTWPLQQIYSLVLRG